MEPLKPEDLYRPCDPQAFNFETTDEVPFETVRGDAIGQPRAVKALKFGTGIARKGYNIFALGPPGVGKHSLAREVLSRHAREREAPSDWCYVNHFEEPAKPRILRLPAGEGVNFRRDIERVIEEMSDALKGAFESDEYQNRRRSIEQELKERQHEAFEQLQQKARERNLAVVRTPSGLAFTPVRDGKPLPSEEYQQLPDEERKQIDEEIRNLEQESHRLFQRIPAWERETREKLREMTREVTNYVVDPILDELRKKYESLPPVVEHLNALQRDIVENVQSLLSAGTQEEGGSESGAGGPGRGASDGAAQMSASGARRYQVNVLVSHPHGNGAPVVYEDNPTYANLIGRVEHLAQMGALVTDFNLIKAGSLHRANGGYLILDAHKLLAQPLAWEGLKRALSSEEIKIESPAQMYSLMSTVSLEPEPVPLDIKVTLTGSPILYYLLRELDPDFQELFKVAADFDDQMPRDSESQIEYGRLIAGLVQKERLRPFHREAVARTVEQSARMAGDSEKLSGRMGSVNALLREADFWAGEAGRQTVSAADVDEAINASIYRSDRMRERVHEAIERGTLLIDTEGSQVGQINALAYMHLGDFAFGRPNRVTARIRLGKGEVIDIEREVALSGPIHSKGVLILSGFLGSRYSDNYPLSLSASLVFEQSYSGIEGDSASSAELYALLSAIGEMPVKQSLAVTGSVNQHGFVQAIGGVNEKIEGFFDVCRMRGLNGGQGVLIPAANVKQLMLRSDVVEAVRREEFAIYPVETIDQGIELLTGLPAGEPDEAGRYPRATANGRVQARLIELAQKRGQFSAFSGEMGARSAETNDGE